MLTSDVFRVGIIVNIFWVFIALFLNNRWYKYSLKLNDEWAEICERLCSEIEDYYTKEEEQTEIIRCKDCKHWRDSDGVYRRGVNAESKCPLNTKEVYAGTFYCGDAERRTDE